MALFRPATVDGVLAAFSKNISDLEAVEAYNRESEKTKQEIATKMQVEAMQHKLEADRAISVAKKIKDLIG